MSKEITIRCKAFSTEAARKYRVQVQDDGTVLVWDSVACHYTSCHAMRPSAVQRARKIAELKV